MRVVSLVLFCVVLLSLASAAIAQENASRDFKLQFYTDYCNCDEDCGEFSSCLSDKTDLFIKNLNTKTSDKIIEAKEEGYKGICTAVTVDGELMIYSMTDECVVEELEEDPEADENETDEPENTADSDESDDTENDETPDSNNRIITIDFTEQNGVYEENPNDKTGGFNMDLITGAIISGTIVLVGFFALMAWMAYLLQKKAVDVKKK